MGLEPLVPREEALQSELSFCLQVTPTSYPRDMGLEYCILAHPVSLWFLLYISSCGKSSSFSLILALEVVIILVCLWEEMSSRSSYSTILATPSIMIYILFAFLFLAIPPHIMLDLSSLTRDGTWAPCSGDAES